MRQRRQYAWHPRLEQGGCPAWREEDAARKARREERYSGASNRPRPRRFRRRVAPSLRHLGIRKSGRVSRVILWDRKARRQRLFITRGAPETLERNDG